MRIAVPSYGTRVLPRFGTVRLFWVMEVITERQTITGRTAHPWDAVQDPDLPRWLKGLGVSGVLCGGIHHRLRAGLEREGLWVNSGHRGEVEEVVRGWVADELNPEREGSCATPRNRVGCRGATAGSWLDQPSDEEGDHEDRSDREETVPGGAR